MLAKTPSCPGLTLALSDPGGAQCPAVAQHADEAVLVTKGGGEVVNFDF
jgi:hypothetical protein